MLGRAWLHHHYIDPTKQSTVLGNSKKVLEMLVTGADEATGLIP